MGNSNISNLILWWYLWYLWSIHSHHSHTILRDVHDIHVFYVFCVYVYQDLAGIAAFRSATICRQLTCDIPWLMAPGMVLRDRCPSATRHSSDTFRETLDIRSRRNDDSGRYQIYQMSCIEQMFRCQNRQILGKDKDIADIADIHRCSLWKIQTDEKGSLVLWQNHTKLTRQADVCLADRR